MDENLYLNGTVKKYLEDLASRKSVPGGGSVSALTAAMGAGLNLMVINFSFKKDSGCPGDVELCGMKKAQETILEKLGHLIDEDCAVLTELLSSLRSEGKDDGVFRKAAEVPMEICRESLESIKMTLDLMSCSNKNLISDVGAASRLLESAFRAAELNVLINIRNIADKEYVKTVMAELDRMGSAVSDIAEKINGDITRLGWKD